MADPELLGVLTRHQAELAPSYETCLNGITAFINREDTAASMNAKIDAHAGHLRDIAQDFLGERDIHDPHIVGVFIMNHTAYHLCALQKRVDESTAFTVPVSLEAIQEGADVHAHRIIDQAKAGGEIDVIDSAHEFIIGSIANYVNTLSQYADYVNNRKIIVTPGQRNTFKPKHYLRFIN